MNFLDEKLTNIRSQMIERQRLQKLLQKACDQQKELQNKKEELKDKLTKEELDVEKLEGLSVKSIFHSIIGNKVEKLDKEKKEALSAKFKYDSVCTELEKVNREIMDIKRQMSQLGDLDREYEKLLQEKERILSNSSTEIRKKLDRLLEEKAHINSRIKELKEAISAGNSLLTSLYRVQESLNSAQNWGVWDMLGGGLISTMAKHSRIDEAKSQINQAQSLLNRFHRELQDVGGSIDVANIEIGSFLTFADYFFDGLFADLAVQSKINDAKSRVENTIYNVQNIMHRLENDLKNCVNQLQNSENEKKNIILNS